MDRRTFLAGTGSLATALAGCSSLPGQGDSETTTGGGNLSHESATALDSQPTLGPDPTDAKAVIVAFEDPSCTRCAAFERDVMPKIESNLVQPGDAAFVFRGYPVVYDWGEPATHALEATYARDATAFWRLVEHYFRNQSSFRGSDDETVYSKTETFLDSETGVDAASVVDAATGDAAQSAVQTDLDAGEAAGAGRTTPHIFLFRDGTYRTKVQGSVSYEAIANVLQL